MKQIKRNCLAALCAAAFLAASSLNAADTKTYQVTGPVLEVTPTAITVQKGNDKWEIARGSKTKITGDLKVGTKVTIYYTMVAAEVEVKKPKPRNRQRNRCPASPARGKKNSLHRMASRGARRIKERDGQFCPGGRLCAPTSCPNYAFWSLTTETNAFHRVHQTRSPSLPIQQPFREAIPIFLPFASCRARIPA